MTLRELLQSVDAEAYDSIPLFVAIELELTEYLKEEDADALISQFSRSCRL